MRSLRSMNGRFGFYNSFHVSVSLVPGDGTTLPYHYLLSFVAVAGNKKEVSMEQDHAHNTTKERTKHRTKQNAKVDTNVMHNYNQ